MYSYDEALAASLEYFNGDELAAKVFVDKYALRDNEGNILEDTPDKMHRRMAKELARIEKGKFAVPLTEDEIYFLFKQFTRILPQGSICYGLGNPHQNVSISNCFVVESPGDSFGHIHKSDEQLSQLSKRRCGVGISLDNIRPNGTATKNSSRTSTGIVPFCERFSNTIRGVGQNSRRGALMECVSVHHPDILDFVRMKLDETKVNGANVSVKLTDDFLNAVTNDTEYLQSWPINSKTPLVEKRVRAKEVWNEIIRCAWTRAEPGLLFWDNILRESPADCYAEEGFSTEATNPCHRGDTKVLTNMGYFPIKELVNNPKELKVFTVFGEWKQFQCFLSGVNEQLWKITLANDKEIFATAGHEWPVYTSDKFNILRRTDELFPGNHKLLHKYISDSDNVFIGIRKVEKTDLVEDVYDIRVFDETHTYYIEDCFTKNCSELPLSELDSCRLLLLNLFSYVSHPFTSKAKFEFDGFFKDVKLAQRLMDDIVDAEIESIDRILAKIDSDPEPEIIKSTEKSMWLKARKSCENGRRTGTGITALGDTLAALNIQYGSEESIKTTEEIYKCLKLGAYASSVEMAKEIGPFPVWNYEKEKDNPFLNRIKDDKIEGVVDGRDVYALMKEYGRRNIALLTTSPAGTVSILAEIGERYGTTSGIEPTYMTHFMRRKKITHTDSNVKVDYTDKLGDKWQEFVVYASGPLEWMRINESDDLTKSPYHNACAKEINWANRVKIQAAAQRHTDHSISSTVNLPEDVKQEEVAIIYEEAWKSGLKGITVYRDNCRAGVLLEIKETKVEKRPKEVTCDVHHIVVKGKSYYVLVGMLNNKPFEVFAGKNGMLRKKIETGKIIRIRKGYYKAVFDDDDIVISPLGSACDEHEESITRLTSACLQSGGDILVIVEHLEKVNGEMQSFAKAIARALKIYIKDGTAVDEICPECSQESLIRQSGCVQCSNPDCLWSKC